MQESTVQSLKSKVPIWDLSDLYDGPTSQKLQQDIEDLQLAVIDFVEQHGGSISVMEPSVFATAIRTFEDITHVLNRISSYAQLLYASNLSDPDICRFYQTTTEKMTAISADMLFFTLEINRLENNELESMFEDKDVVHYAPWLRDIRTFRQHELNDDVEQALHQKSVTGRLAWSRLFDETMASMRIDVEGDILTLADTLNKLSDPDRRSRKCAAKALGKQLTGHVRLFALITNTLAKDKAIEDHLRDYSSPVAYRNLSNQVGDEVVNALVTAVKSAYPELSHRYYAMKAGWLGTEKLDYWDRNAPLPEQDDRLYTWDEARHIVLSAYRKFDPGLANIGSTFFQEMWIDAALRPGKDSGAFCHPTVPSVHPYILMNYHGKSRDVMTLAHELGHGVHQVLSASKGTLMADTPLTLAETASVFGEMLTFQHMLESEQDHKARQIMIAGKVEDMLNTVVRQISFHEFEKIVHDERQEGELTAERIGEIWMHVQSQCLGPALHFDEDYRNYWAYIPHFIHSPFYVYAYAFGDCLVNSLYDVFQKGCENFQAKYLDMLRAGGTLKYTQLLSPFNLDASDPVFWKRGLGVIAELIDKLEETQK